MMPGDKDVAHFVNYNLREGCLHGSFADLVEESGSLRVPLMISFSPRSNEKAKDDIRIQKDHE